MPGACLVTQLLADLFLLCFIQGVLGDDKEHHPSVALVGLCHRESSVDTG